MRIAETYDHKNTPVHHPQMMVKVIVCAQLEEVRGSRGIDCLLHDSLAFNIYLGDRHRIFVQCPSSEENAMKE